MASVETPRSVSPETTITAYTLEPALRQRADDFAAANHLIYAVGVIWGVLALLLILRLQLAARFQKLAERAAKRRFAQLLVFTPLFVLSMALFDLPLGIWGQSVEKKFGLSIQGWGSFARDWFVGQGVSLVIGVIFIWLIYAVMRKAPRRWWLWAWAAMLPVLAFVIFVEPFVIEPLFFKFSPLAARDPSLAAQLQAIAARGGEQIAQSRMFVMDASEKLRAVNAYVTGFGASKRVVVWDTTLAAMTPREISFVFGHELGHYVLGHVVIGMVLGALGLLFGLWFASRTMGALIRRWGARWGVTRIDQFASLPVILLVATLLSTVTSPFSSAFSRVLEHKADAFGLQAVAGTVDDPQQAAAHAFQRLGEIDLEPVDPGPLTVFWLYDHPPIRDRIAFVVATPPAPDRAATDGK